MEAKDENDKWKETKVCQMLVLSLEQVDLSTTVRRPLYYAPQTEE